MCNAERKQAHPNQYEVKKKRYKKLTTHFSGDSCCHRVAIVQNILFYHID